VSLLRILLAFAAFSLVILPAYALLRHANLHWPDSAQWFWLAASALFGMVVGDLLYYQSLIMLGPRRTTQLSVFAPIAAVIVAWFGMGEILSARALGGIAIVLGATS